METDERSLLNESSEDEKEKPVTINIIGCCASRDIFNTNKGIKYEVKAYIYRNSLFTLLYDVDPKYKIEQSEISDLLPHNFTQRNLCTSVNADARERLINRKGDWLILDTYDIDHPLGIIRYPDSKSRLVQTQYVDQMDILFKRNDKFKDCELVRIKPSDASVNMTYYIDEVADFLKEKWGDKIILINLPRAFIGLDEKGSIQKGSNDYIELQQRSNRMAELLLSKLNCHYVEFPHMVIRDFLKTNDWNYVHYVSEITDYLKYMVDAIVRGHSDVKELCQIRIKYDTILGNIVLGKCASEQNTIKRVNAIIREKDNINQKSVIYDLKKLVDEGNPEAYGALARLYGTGTHFEKDLDKAAEWMRKAANENVGWAKNELFDILWKIGTPEAYGEMISVAIKFAENGDGGAMIRLGRAYRDGRGVKKDFNKALEWMRKASEKTWQSGRELVDNLLRGTEEEYHNEAFVVCSRLINEKKDGESMGRLGRIYRDGKGVEKNLNKAAEWMRKAADKNVKWAKNELFDILWQIGTESYKEMMAVALSYSKTGDQGAILRLGRAYRDGKGVEKNLEKSVEYFKKVADKHPNWVAEASDVMLRTENPDNWKYAFTLCYEIANDPSPKWNGLVKAGVMGRLSHMYRDGKGVEKDLDKAVEWMYKATKQHSKWDKELEETILNVGVEKCV